MVKNINKVLLMSFIFAVLIFGLGVYLGHSLDALRINDVNNLLYDSELSTINYLSSKEFLDLFEEDNSCGSTQILLENVGPDLFELGNILTSYEDRGLFSGNEYKLLKIKYFLVELRAYVLFTQMKNECDSDFDLIVYFYDQDHADSRSQGYVLDALVRSHDNLHVFSFDRELLDSDVVKLLVSHYGVVESPTLIINGDTKLEGFSGFEEINDILEV